MEPWDICLNDIGTMVKFGALGAGIGMGVDAAPILGRRAKGLRLSVRF